MRGSKGLNMEAEGAQETARMASSLAPINELLTSEQAYCKVSLHENPLSSRTRLPDWQSL